MKGDRKMWINEETSEELYSEEEVRNSIVENLDEDWICEAMTNIFSLWKIYQHLDEEMKMEILENAESLYREDCITEYEDEEEEEEDEN